MKLFTLTAMAMLVGCSSTPPVVHRPVVEREQVCTMRSTAHTQITQTLEDVADIRPMITSVGNNAYKCSITARVQYKQAWYNVYGENTDSLSVSQNDVCLAAVKDAMVTFLAGKESTTVTAEQQMVCTDEPAIKTRPVEKGERIRISEVKPHPAKPTSFPYNGTECKMFIEQGVRNSMLYEWQGVACKTGRNGGDEWTVLDKF
jgi:uncharacterized protein YcfL